MFPLGSVLVPGMILPLHVFEPRYRRLVHDCLAGDGQFGVVLIERGSEVGGGDVRTDVGTVARIVQADELPDGRFVVGAVGLRRIRVTRWLPDDPYPRAEVADWPDVPVAADGTDDAGDADARVDRGGAGETTSEAAAPGTEEVAALLRRAAALSSELGEPAPPLDLELSDDRVVAGYQATALAPLGPADRQALLCTPTLGGRFELLRELLADHVELLQARLSSG
jgi:Lon protease-like protein